VATEKKGKEPVDDENIVNCLPKEIVLNILAAHVLYAAPVLFDSILNLGALLSVDNYHY
jgi:hypothetical protein